MTKLRSRLDSSARTQTSPNRHRRQGDQLRREVSDVSLGTEGVDHSELAGGEVEVEHIDVLGDPLRVGRLRDNRAALLQVLAQHDLGRSLLVALARRAMTGSCRVLLWWPCRSDEAAACRLQSVAPSLKRFE